VGPGGPADAGRGRRPVSFPGVISAGDWEKFSSLFCPFEFETVAFCFVLFLPK
jgi:hypothetical protein